MRFLSICFLLVCFLTLFASIQGQKYRIANPLNKVCQLVCGAECNAKRCPEGCELSAGSQTVLGECVCTCPEF